MLASFEVSDDSEDDELLLLLEDEDEELLLLEMLDSRLVFDGSSGACC